MNRESNKPGSADFATLAADRHVMCEMGRDLRWASRIGNFS